MKGLETLSEFTCSKSETEKLTATEKHCSYEQLIDRDTAQPDPAFLCRSTEEWNLDRLIRINYFGPEIVEKTMIVSSESSFFPLNEKSWTK